MGIAMRSERVRWALWMGSALMSEREQPERMADAQEPAGDVSVGASEDDGVLEDDGAVGALVARCAAGEEDAWREFLDMYGRRVFALCKSRVRSPELAEEITQSVFATVAVKLRDGGYADSGRFEAWLFRVAMNRVRDEIRRQRRAATPTDPEHFGSLGGARGAEEERADLSPDLERLREAMGSLSDADREVIELRHHGQMGFKEMAEMLDEPMGTLLARHHRALKKLRTALEKAPAVEGQA